MKTLGDFLTIEDDPRILDFKYEFDEFLMWPFIRYSLFQDILLAKEYNFLKVQTTNNLYHKIKHIKAAVKYNPFQRTLNRNFDILMFSTCLGDIKKENKYFNRIVDYFGLMNINNTLLIENSFEWKYFKPRFFPNVCGHDYIGLKAYIKSKFTSTSKNDINTIRDFLNYLNSNLRDELTESDFSKLKRRLLFYSKGLSELKDCYHRLFDRYNPKIVFLEDAAYGLKSYILKWARERDIVTIEPQHGAVSPNNAAYNYGKALLGSSIYLKYLPDYYLTYGKLWEDLINFPVRKITIGNPHRPENIKLIKARTKAPRKITILIISGHIVSHMTSKLALELTDMIDPNVFEILFRPHPREWPTIRQSYPELLTTDHIRIDTEGDIYVSLLHSDFVIGFNSTALFEALGICKAVFVIEHPGSELDIPRSTFKRFSTAQELLRLIQNHRSEDEIDTNYVWEPNWEANYKRFIETVL